MLVPMWGCPGDKLLVCSEQQWHHGDAFLGRALRDTGYRVQELDLEGFLRRGGRQTQKGKQHTAALTCGT